MSGTTMHLNPLPQLLPGEQRLTLLANGLKRRRI